MTFDIKYKESFSRGELLLRAFFGYVYIIIPHMFILMFVSMWANILSFISWWIVLFTGSYPESYFETQVNLIKWNTRLSARIMNLADGYPAFGLNAEDEDIVVEIPYPETLSRGQLLLKTFFGSIYVVVPHMFMLIFRMIWGQILSFLAFWSVLFTGSYPQSWHEFNVGTLRWLTRVNLYMAFMTDDYPPFSGKA